MTDDEYTPTTDEVRQAAGDIFCTDPDDPCHKDGCPGDELFDRWLTQHDREVAAKALRDMAARVRKDWLPDHCPWVGALDDEADRIECASEADRG